MAATKKNLFDKFANSITQFTGSSNAFISAVLVILLWAITGPLFGYSETWQLIKYGHYNYYLFNGLFDSEGPE